ncbi:hypothetical protein [Nocardia sp. NPDC052566]|uniref:hypothetical protein n=1 Tax=Nocardia sp. NPDC052566 TaxID=3364330 RepID=UPI0037C597FC
MGGKPDDVWKRLRGQAHGGTISIPHDLAVNAANALGDAEGRLAAISARSNWLEFDPGGFGTLPSPVGSNNLGYEFQVQGRKLTGILGKHLTTLRNMRETFVLADEKYKSQEKHSASWFQRLVPIPKSIGDELLMHGGSDDPQSTAPSSAQSAYDAGRDRKSLGDDAMGINSKEIELSHTKVDFVDGSSLNWGQLYTLGTTINAGPILRAAENWIWLANELDIATRDLRMGMDKAFTGWKGAEDGGRNAAAAAFKTYQADVGALRDSMTLMGYELATAAGWLEGTPPLMPRKSTPDRVYDYAVVGTVRGDRGWVRLTKIRADYNAQYLAGFRDAKVPVLASKASAGAGPKVRDPHKKTTTTVNPKDKTGPSGSTVGPKGGTGPKGGNQGNDKPKSGFTRASVPIQIDEGVKHINKGINKINSGADLIAKGQLLVQQGYVDLGKEKIKDGQSLIRQGRSEIRTGRDYIDGADKSTKAGDQAKQAGAKYLKLGQDALDQSKKYTETTGQPPVNGPGLPSSTQATQPQTVQGQSGTVTTQSVPGNSSAPAASTYGDSGQTTSTGQSSSGQTAASASSQDPLSQIAGVAQQISGIAQQAGQGLQGLLQSGLIPNAAGLPGAIAPAGLPDAASLGGGSDAGVGGGPGPGPGPGNGPAGPEMTRDYPARLFPRAGGEVLSATDWRSGLATGQSTAGPPGAPGAGAPYGGHGAGMGQGQEHKRPKFLFSPEHLEEALGEAPPVYKPVIDR